MCGMYGQGFWWENENKIKEYEVVFDFEYNSHSVSKEKRQGLIPLYAKRCGFDPVNMKPITNESGVLPDEVYEKIKILGQAYFPNKECIGEWIINNYAKNGDKDEWDVELTKMLGDGGVGLFNAQYYRNRITYYKREIIDYENHIASRSHETAYFKSQITYCKNLIIKYENQIKKDEDLISRCTGLLIEMDIYKFIDYFLDYPNEYWSERRKKREVVYQHFVTA